MAEQHQPSLPGLFLLLLPQTPNDLLRGGVRATELPAAVVTLAMICTKRCLDLPPPQLLPPEKLRLHRCP
jgi:hypothetical protein